MKKFLIGAAFVMISATVHAETYQVDGVTIHVPTHCASSSCVSVDAPGYGYHHAGKQAKARTSVKTAAVAPKKADKIAATPVADAAPAVTPAPVAEAAPAKAPEASVSPAADAATK